MARGPRYRVSFRRRREGKTDYKARKGLLLSGKPRLVPRVSHKNAVVQIVEAKLNGDQVLVSAHSRELTDNHGWKAPNGNVPAAYLTGLLCGLKAGAKGVKEAVLDTGLHSPTKGSRVFAALKGVLDAGVDVPHSKDKIPEESRTQGKHIEDYAKTLAPAVEEYQTSFSKYLKNDLRPENLVKHFAEVKMDILESLRGGKRV